MKTKRFQYIGVGTLAQSLVARDKKMLLNPSILLVLAEAAEGKALSLCEMTTARGDLLVRGVSQAK